MRLIRSRNDHVLIPTSYLLELPVSVGGSNRIGSAKCECEMKSVQERVSDDGATSFFSPSPLSSFPPSIDVLESCDIN